MLPQFLQNLSNNESQSTHFINYTTDTIVAILQHLGNPHKKLQCIHIAGTNGKGSTAYMIANILQYSGYTVGLYTSPHLLRYNERIKINDIEITYEEICHYANILETLCTKYHYTPTFFDAFTIIALLHFHNSVDIAVIETGLGGRLDSTNVVMPLVSVITPISYDHMAILGTSLEKIAYQKAGIIKNGIPVVSANQQLEAKNVLKEEAQSKHSQIFFVGDEISYTIKSSNPLIFDMVFKNPVFRHCQKFDDIHCALTGDFQAENAAVAIATSLLLKNNRWAITPTSIYQAMSSLRIPGRCQMLCDKPLVLFDCAHNPQALEYTLSNIYNKYSDYDIIFCVSFMKDKDVNSMLNILKRYTTKQIYYLQLTDNRCYQPDDKTIQLYSLSVFDDIAQLVKNMEHDFKETTLVYFTGTFRLYPYAYTICEMLQKC